ncbi:uncharacterized protein BCR38DRAFT_93953 [Pseudomassariella vexata]|uniref:Uncharacterized protein n=1 Tax=Pseudomassariella vexata TaxID=1141098 RepID=A0A1Y2EE34_9PEZI|nr:uncharacterized protein BCR38DRAFT_93953 [Pseudomassariella vexata]ORY69843.1 hypothetical protein BCR38DRAFT_93953 [Pseudomassariella vexata]
MAPVEMNHEPSYMALAVTLAHLGLIVYLTYSVGASLYTSYRSLPPSQDTRQRLSQRVKLVPVFVGLSAVALSLATYSSIGYATLSYKTWADERGVDLPEHFIGEKGFFSDTKNSSQIYLTRWLNDTPVYYDALEIIAEKARRFWWGQQIDLATVTWSMLLAIEGRRRRVPLLSAFMGLAHLVNLSFAQNLFYLALLLTPSPIPSGQDDLKLPVAPLASRWERIRNTLMPPKPDNWCPHPALYLATLSLNFTAVFLLPYAVERPSFVTVVLLTRASTFMPLLIPKVVPAKWGTVHAHPHNAYSSFTGLFRFISVASFMLHAKASFLGLSYNAPDSHVHRHSRFIPWDVEKRSTWERGTTALGKVLGSTSDHPVVAAVGWDALICALSLGLWAAVRNADVQDIVTSIVPFHKSPACQSAAPKEITSKSTMKRELDVTTESSEPEGQITLRRQARHKPRVASVASVASSSEEVAAPTPRKRGRPKKKQPASEPGSEPVAEQAYKPTAKEARDALEGDVLPPEELDWESAALTWGLSALGGLGSASAGVFGGECISR